MLPLPSSTHELQGWRRSVTISSTYLLELRRCRKRHLRHSETMVMTRVRNMLGQWTSEEMRV